MKIYVDGELPKECFDCPYHNGENGNCKILNKYTEYMPKDCLLHSLSDHDQKVRADERKKVVQEIISTFDKYKNKPIYNSNGDVCGVYNGFSYNEIMNILDQVKGGNNVKD